MRAHRASPCQGLTIGVDLLQTLSMFRGFAFPWPAAVKAMLAVTSVSTFAVEIAAPTCTISFSYQAEWVAMQLFPPVMAAVLVFGVVLANFAPLARGRRGFDRASVGQAFAATTDTIVGGVFTLLYYTYFTASVPGAPCFHFVVRWFHDGGLRLVLG